MSSTDPEIDGSEARALTDLLESDGWKRYAAMIDATWGAEATLQRIQQRIGQMPMGDQAAVNDATQHILSAQRQILALKDWPKARLQQLREPAAVTRPFAAHRRIGS